MKSIKFVLFSVFLMVSAFAQAGVAGVCNIQTGACKDLDGNPIKLIKAPTITTNHTPKISENHSPTITSNHYPTITSNHSPNISSSHSPRITSTTYGKCGYKAEYC